MNESGWRVELQLPRERPVLEYTQYDQLVTVWFR